MSRILKTYGLYFAWVISMMATGGSLYFSEIRQFIPCQLCWFQRIFMYPLVILLGIASYRGDRQIAVYVLSLSVAGGLLASFHYLEQKIPGFRAAAFCGVGVPCDVQYINWWGFITIPLLSLIAFSSIIAIMIRRAK